MTTEKRFMASTLAMGEASVEAQARMAAAWERVATAVERVADAVERITGTGRPAEGSSASATRKRKC